MEFVSFKIMFFANTTLPIGHAKTVPYMKLKQSISTMATDKENPNPTIHLTQKRTQLSQSSDAPLLGSHSIRRYALGSKIILGLGHGSNADYADIESTLPSVPTAEERLVAVALSEAACINDKNVIINPLTDNISPYVELLHNAGFPMFKQHQLQNALKTPSFTPCGISKSTNATTQKRDAITANEVFEIIRNIQDPEHPLTLEQLNVVRIELVEVVDVHPDIGKEAAIQKGDKKPKFSTVRVQFT
jgi:hypothetical protein